MLTKCALALLVVLTAAACGSGATTWEVTESENLAELSVDVGDEIAVVLEENPSTGFAWVIPLAPEMLSLASDEYLEPNEDLVGASGTHRFEFEVTTEGAGVLRFEYVRPFDDPIVPERVVEYIVVASDAAWAPENGTSAGTSTATAPSG